VQYLVSICIQLQQVDNARSISNISLHVNITRAPRVILAIIRNFVLGVLIDLTSHQWDHALVHFGNHMVIGCYMAQLVPHDPSTDAIGQEDSTLSLIVHYRHD